MRAVAIGLVLRTAAGAPKFLAGLFVDNVGGLAWGFGHEWWILSIGIKSRGAKIQAFGLFAGSE